MTLTGHIAGQNQSDLMNQVIEIAQNYYATECVHVALIDPVADVEQHTIRGYQDIGGRTETTLVNFEADWRAEVRHRWDHVTRDKCMRCGARK